MNADGSFLALNNVSSTCTEAPGSILRLLFSVLDGDSDGLPDQWERAYGLNPLNASDAALDSDGDGLTNLQEYQLGTNPNVADQGISGRVTDASNPTLGIANVDVWAQDLNGYWMGGTRTDSNGNYIFNCPGIEAYFVITYR